MSRNDEQGGRFSWRTLPRVLFALLALLSLSLAAQVHDSWAQNQNRYKMTNLVSDIADEAPVTDENLVNPWGLARTAQGPWWVANNGTGTSTVYDGEGQPAPTANPLIVKIPQPQSATGAAAPTGIVANSTNDFEISSGKPARFIFVTEGGTISAWSPDADQANAILKADNSSSDAIYKGAAIANDGSRNLLYVANFKSGRVEAYGSDFKRVTMPSDAFVDDQIPEGFAPFNIVNIDGRLFVTFAKQDENKEDDVAGPRLGYVDVFDASGTLADRLQHGPWLNAPWGVAMAPANFGRFGGMLLVGQFGSGRIVAFNPDTGKFLGYLRDENRRRISIDGLWGLVFGNGGQAGETTELFFTAGLDDEQHGLFGKLAPVSSTSGGGQSGGMQ